jgi:lipopolysaccharide biosynthesis glycosyltransferase
MADVDEVISFDAAPYASIPFTGSYYGPEIYFKLELFNLRGYDRVVYLDCDTIVLDDISPLWNLNEYAERNFYAVRESREMGVHPDVIGKFNTGVMVVNRPLLAESTHRRMLEVACEGTSYDGGDQGVINRYLDEMPGAGAGELDAGYNVLVRARRFGHWDSFKDRIRILHYVNRVKPWALDHQRDALFDPEFKRLWDEAYRC